MKFKDTELYWFFPRLKFKIEMAWFRFKSRCQRFKRGYAYTDVWNMDSWFIDTVKPMLIHLRDHGIATPAMLWDDGENNRANWEAVLTEMVDCLTLMDEDNVYNYLFGESFNENRTSEDWHHVRDVMDQNKNRFFELFSKYFYHLWD